MQQRKIFSFTQNVFILSLVSLLNDIGGQTIKYALPLFLTNALGVKISIVGLIEGITEATPTLFQPLSGYLSDTLKKRKPLVAFGQFLRSLILLLFIANSWWIVLFVRFLDRSGKGIQGAPRDALLSASTTKTHQGKAFGLSRAFDNIGAVIGLILAGLITIIGGKNVLALTTEVFHTIVLLAVIPAIISFLLIIFFVSDVSASHGKKSAVNLKNHLGKKFYSFLGIAFLFTLGNSSDAFLILKAQAAGLHLASIFFLLALFSLVAGVISLPAGMLSDKIGRKKTILAGWFLYSLVYLGFAQSRNAVTIIFLFLLYGVYYGFAEGAAKAYVADIVPEYKKGTAFGLYNLVIGATLFPASLIAGYLWQTSSPATAFNFGSLMAFIASIGFLVIK